MTDQLLTVNDLHVHFSVPGKGILGRSRILKAVNGVNFDLRPGETLGVVGESGCGKSTLARAILGLVKAAGGSVVLSGEELVGQSLKQLRDKREHMQVIFQDPLASLDPRMTVGQIIAEPLTTFYPKLSRDDVRARVKNIMSKVGLLPNLINRYPHEFSGGQCQRIGIARALILKPKLIICDEPVSALDVSIQAQIINLLMEIQNEMGLSLIFIAHDLSVVRHISQRVLVMYLGRVVEISDRDTLYENPRHPYTRALIDAVPIPDPVKERSKQSRLLGGDLPSPLNLPSGCPFRTRCPSATDICAIEEPQLREIETGVQVACHAVD